MPVEPGELTSWVDAGIITEDQRERILALEASKPSGSLVWREVLGYVGAALVLVAAFVLVGDLWTDMSRVARVTTSLFGAAVLLVAGLYFGASETPAIRRVGRALQLLAVPPFGLAIGITVDAWVEENWAVFIGFTAAAVLAGVLYWRDRSWAQHLALFGSSLGMTISISWEGELLFAAGAAAVALGVIWLLGTSMGHLPPRMLGEMAGIAALFVGSVQITSAADWASTGGLAAMVLWIAVSIAILAIGVVRDRVVLIVGGVLGLLMYLTSLIFEVFEEGVGGPLSLLVAGTILVSAAVYLTRRANRA